MNDPTPWVRSDGTRVSDPGDNVDDYTYDPRKGFDDHRNDTGWPNFTYLRSQI